MYILLEIVFTVLLACGVFFGGVWFGRVYQQNSKPTKVFKVTDKNRARTVLLKYTSFESLTEKCRAKFNLRYYEKLLFASGEDEEIEVDEECLGHLEDKSLLIVKGETDASGHNDDYDDGDDNDDLEFEVRGTNNNIDDTVVDNADIEMLEDKQKEFEVRGTNSNIGDTVVGNADIERWENIQKGGVFKEHFKKNGLKNITSALIENVNAWKSKPLNIAVIGESGKGKSSFINAFRELSAGDKGAAKIDEVECTIDCRAFRYPRYDNFVLWDVPGVGTISFPKARYLSAIQIDRFDFFMIISSTRFSELDIWLAREVMERQKRFYFIRTKIDIDMKNRERRFALLQKVFNEDEEFKNMKTNMSNMLQKAFIQVDKLHFFMVSNNDPGKYDFPDILNQLLHDVPAEKKASMVFGLKGMSKSILEETASALKSRIWKVALLSVVGSDIPIPILPANLNTEIILKEIRLYREQFGLDEQTLEHLAHMAGTSLKDLKKSLEFKTPDSLFTSAGLEKYLKEYTVRNIGKTDVKYMIPVVEFVPSGISYRITAAILEDLLEIMKQDALKVLMYAITS